MKTGSISIKKYNGQTGNYDLIRFETATQEQIDRIEKYFSENSEVSGFYQLDIETEEGEKKVFRTSWSDLSGYLATQ